MSHRLDASPNLLGHPRRIKVALPLLLFILSLCVACSDPASPMPSQDTPDAAAPDRPDMISDMAPDDASLDLAKDTAAYDLAEPPLDADPVIPNDADANPSPDDQGGDIITPDEPPRGSLRLIPVEWGIFPPDTPLPTPRTLELGDASAVPHTLSPGVWSIFWVDPEGAEWTLTSTRLTGLVRHDPLVPVSQAGADTARIFTAIDEPITLEITPERHLRITRTTPEPAPDWQQWDLPTRDTTQVGPLFDEALYAMNMGQPDDVAVGRLLDALRERGQGPVMTSAGQLFLAPGEDQGATPEARGSFNNWTARSEHTLLRKLSGKLWARYIQVPPAPHSYKIVYDDLLGNASWFTDRANRHIAWDGFNPGTVGSFNSTLHIGPTSASPTSPSRLVWVRGFASQALANARDLYIYLPPGYDASPARRYPTLYIHDGNESIVRSQFHEVASLRFAAHPDEAAILVFVALPSQNVRLDEYTMGTPGSRGDAYASMLAQELVPWVDARFRTITSPESRGLMGASLGGLISFWTATRHTGVFGYAAGMSSSLFWDDRLMIREVERLGCQGLTYYLDSGSPQDNADVTRQLRDVLVALECDHEHVEEPNGQHDWSFWRRRFPNVLRTFATMHQRTP